MLCWLLLLWPITGFIAIATLVALMNTWAVDPEWKDPMVWLFVFPLGSFLGPTAFAFVFGEWTSSHNGRGFSAQGLTRPYPWWLRWLPKVNKGEHEPKLTITLIPDSVELLHLRTLYNCENPDPSDLEEPE